MVRKIDLSVGKDIKFDTDVLHLVKIGSRWMIGRFTKQWYGYVFCPTNDGTAIRYDPPGPNSLNWTYVFEFDPEIMVEISNDVDNMIKKLTYEFDKSDST